MKEEFTVEELASYLHWTPMQVIKLASREKLPGRKVAGQWRFNEVEIHHWIEDEIGRADDEALGRVEAILERAETRETGRAEMIHLEKLIPVECVLIGTQSRSKRGVVREICDHCADAGWIWDPEQMTEAVLDREAMHTTALENGVALLHPRRPLPSILADRFVTLAVSTAGIPFGGPRGALTDIFFLLGSTDDGIHLRVLARLSRLFAIPGFLTELRRVESPGKAVDLIQKMDAVISE
ncbi:MAG: PTS sugar transporter subunit IIA [Planctomycetota bacterium]|nr:PTS sugar transporter subunit IIA [Planctomycetota bacterium]